MNIQVLSDQHLLNNYRSGDQSAISKLIERHKRDRKSTRLNSSHIEESRMPSSA